ncbi:CBM9 family sugar-binding protein [Chitinophaga sedimenti]|uniref:CBM9 family sugar-binding protein n=1 Tax=Chitinophaga sedimenti TaxID=2033606 RepID=UPI0020049B02|nr:CBM9 family sugar-binding protein [Chitinophaga sedimenti]MCK7559620.1 CBM9 family sugar-binding protein [Chitinophaga sedimenti]
MKHLLTIFLLAMMAISCRQRAGTETKAKEKADSLRVEPAANLLPSKLVAPKAVVPPKLDGLPDDSCWFLANWQPIDQNWVGQLYDSLDFAGRYKVAWDAGQLYILAQITDDTLRTTNKPLESYLNDDALILYIDENHSGGDHQYNYNAFAYHLRLDDRTVDVGADSSAHLFPGHCTVNRNTRGNTTTWEIAVRLYPDNYKDNATNTPVELKEGKHIGFAIAYNDADRGPARDNLVGSVYIDGDNKNIAWIDASVFADLLEAK